MPLPDALPALPDIFPERLQDVPPTAARFCLGIARFIRHELDVSLRDKHVLIGFSGGADSTALLLVMHFLAPALRMRLVAAHLDHALRPTSAKEAEACLFLCERLGIPCLVRRVDVADKAREWRIGTEESARKVRYEFYAAAMQERNCTILALGHQNNDLAEDILMRLIRGTGWPSLGGMAGSDPGRGLIRPLLLTPREKLEEFLQTLGARWVFDASNKDPAYLRNRVRNNIIPLFLQENPSFLQSAAHLWRMARIDAAYFDELLSGLPLPDSASPGSATGSVSSTEFTAPAELLLGLHKALRLRYYKKIMEVSGPGQAQLPGLFALDKAWQGSPEPTTHMLPGNKEAFVRKKAITWRTGRPRRKT